MYINFFQATQKEFFIMLFISTIQLLNEARFQMTPHPRHVPNKTMWTVTLFWQSPWVIKFFGKIPYYILDIKPFLILAH